MIAVTFALPSESSAFAHRLTERAHSGDIVRGRCHGHAISVFHTGVGEKVTRARIAAFLDTERPELLISGGFAGALTDTWNPGDLLIGQNFSSAELYAAAQSALPNARSGRLATVQMIVDSPAARAQLAETQAADAVDMETEFIAAACRARSIPILSLRVISDTPAAPFPAPPAVLFDIERQRTNLRQLFSYLGTHPSSLVSFMRFAARIARARTNLADALQLLLNSGTALPR